MTQKLYLKSPVFLVAAIFSITADAQTIQPQPATYNQTLPSSSLLFMENKGQVADRQGKLRPDILFTANSAGAKLYVSANAIHYQFTKTEYPKGYDPHNKEPAMDPRKEAELQKHIKTSTHRFSLELQGATANPEIIVENQSAYTENYYLPQCPDGITGVHAYEKIVCKNVYPKIDWVIYSNGGFMEYDFLVHPGGNADQIRLKIKDADSVSITVTGELLMKTSLGEVREKAPVSYANKKKVESHFKHFEDGTIGFDVQQQPGKELRIDPSIIWATYYGTTGDDQGHRIAFDGGGNVYMSGYTESMSGVASGGFQNTNGGATPSPGDALLVKFNNNGSRIWATYYSGSDQDYGRGCAVDGSGNIYMSGYTGSTGVIAFNGFQNTLGGGNPGNFDDFLVKFNSSGSRIWGTYYGGGGIENSSSCVLDKNGDVYMAGSAGSPGLAAGGYQSTPGGLQDGFLVKFNGAGARLWATYYGGSGTEFGFSCTTDKTGNVYLAGTTVSSTGLSFNGFQNSPGGGGLDGYLVKFNTNGSRLWATYYGGNDYDYLECCTADSDDNVYISGETFSTTGIASGGFQNTYAGGNSFFGDAYLVKFSSTGSRIWGTYYGGAGAELGSSCVVDGANNIYLTGSTGSGSGISAGGFQNTYGGSNYDVMLVKFNAAGNRMWSTYYGGPETDYGFYGAVDGNGVIFITGRTFSSTGIAYNGFQNNFGGGTNADAFLTKIDGNGGILPILFTSVKAYQYADNIQVEWRVQQENNIRSYEIEKSENGITFKKSGEKNVANSFVYQWLDLNPIAGNHFYRIKSIGLDGEVKYSQVVKVVTGRTKPAFQIYPNPTKNNTINLSFINQPEGIYTIRLLNVLSQVILHKQISHYGGSSAEMIHLNNISKGSYLLEIIAPGNQHQSLKVIY